MELWSLLSITAPGPVSRARRGSADYYATPIEKAGDPELLAQLRRRIKPLIMRRTKEQVATDLPAKQEQILEVELPTRAPHALRDPAAARAPEGPRAGRRRATATASRSCSRSPLLRQLSLDPGLVDDAHDTLAPAPSSTRCSSSSRRHRRRPPGAGLQPVHRVPRPGARPPRRRRHRLLLPRRHAPATAPTVIQRFKDGDAPVFLISLKAGGFGLNLTEADYCFLLDPWWNPATEAQAVDRTHRIGQTRNVMVYRLIATDTIEEKVMALQGPQGRAVRQRHGRRRRLRRHARPPTTSAACSAERAPLSLTDGVEVQTQRNRSIGRERAGDRR